MSVLLKDLTLEDCGVLQISKTNLVWINFDVQIVN